MTPLPTDTEYVVFPSLAGRLSLLPAFSAVPIEPSVDLAQAVPRKLSEARAPVPNAAGERPEPMLVDSGSAAPEALPSLVDPDAMPEL